MFGGDVVARRARGLGYSSCGCHLWKKHGFPKPRGEGGVPFNIPADRQSWVSFDAVTSSVRLIDRGSVTVFQIVGSALLWSISVLGRIFL